MAIYFDTTSNSEDINFIKELIDKNHAYYHKKEIHYYNIYRFEDYTDHGTTILWKECDINCPEKYPGENKPIKTPWGTGKWTSEGINYIYLQLMKLRRYTTS